MQSQWFKPALTSQSRLESYKHLISVGEANVSVSRGERLGLVSVSSFKVLCPSLVQMVIQCAEGHWSNIH